MASQNNNDLFLIILQNLEDMIHNRALNDQIWYTNIFGEITMAQSSILRANQPNENQNLAVIVRVDLERHTRSIT